MQTEYMVPQSRWMPDQVRHDKNLKKTTGVIPGLTRNLYKYALPPANPAHTRHIFIFMCNVY